MVKGRIFESAVAWIRRASQLARDFALHILVERTRGTAVPRRALRKGAQERPLHHNGNKILVAPNITG